jgi:hypothetical protein
MLSESTFSGVRTVNGMVKGGFCFQDMNHVSLDVRFYPKLPIVPAMIGDNVVLFMVFIFY